MMLPMVNSSEISPIYRIAQVLCYISQHSNAYLRLAEITGPCLIIKYQQMARQVSFLRSVSVLMYR